jgi:hypothetical protein
MLDWTHRSENNEFIALSGKRVNFGGIVRRHARLEQPLTVGKFHRNAEGRTKKRKKERVKRGRSNFSQVERTTRKQGPQSPRLFGSLGELCGVALGYDNAEPFFALGRCRADTGSRVDAQKRLHIAKKQTNRSDAHHVLGE